MPDRYGRMDWRDRDYRDREPRHEAQDERRDDRRARNEDPLEDYGQADFSREYAYDPNNRTGYRVDPKEEARRRYEDDPAVTDDRERLRADPRYDDRYDAPPRTEERSWAERSGLAGMFGGRSDRRSNDRVLWVVATEALHKARGIDDRDVHVHVEEAVVTLEGTVRSREEKRRIEDLVDQRGVRDVRNNLRIRERRLF
ncbi:MAG: hypothetical protein JWO33_2749 [Caulobacteraceae bacterium]|nr:hypothetical protein [Caulobacteraceae bacterium]